MDENFDDGTVPEGDQHDDMQRVLDEIQEDLGEGEEEEEAMEEEVEELEDEEEEEDFEEDEEEEEVIPRRVVSKSFTVKVRESNETVYHEIGIDNETDPFSDNIKEISRLVENQETVDYIYNVCQAVVDNVFGQNGFTKPTREMWQGVASELVNEDERDDVLSIWETSANLTVAVNNLCFAMYQYKLKWHRYVSNFSLFSDSKAKILDMTNRCIQAHKTYPSVKKDDIYTIVSSLVNIEKIGVKYGEPLQEVIEYLQNP